MKERNEMDLAHLGTAVRAYRKDKKMSQLELSLLAGVSKNYVADLENGRRNPSYLTLIKILKPLGKSLKDIDFHKK